MRRRHSNQDQQYLPNTKLNALLMKQRRGNKYLDSPELWVEKIVFCIYHLESPVDYNCLSLTLPLTVRLTRPRCQYLICWGPGPARITVCCEIFWLLVISWCLAFTNLLPPDWWPQKLMNLHSNTDTRRSIATKRIQAGRVGPFLPGEDSCSLHLVTSSSPLSWLMVITT